MRLKQNLDINDGLKVLLTPMKTGFILKKTQINLFTTFFLINDYIFHSAIIYSILPSFLQ